MSGEGNLSLGMMGTFCSSQHFREDPCLSIAGGFHTHFKGFFFGGGGD